MYYYGARYYNPQISAWLSVDPLVEQTMDAYGYCYQNPLMYTDPTGMSGESTIVKDLGNGKYQVLGGDLNDGDKGIYIDDGNGGKGKKNGESAHMYSFYNEHQQDKKEGLKVGWVGTIDTNSREGNNWINDKIFNNELGLIEYMAKALSGNSLDHKRLDENGVPLDKKDPRYNDRDYHHRGSYWNTKDDGTVIYGSARDYGNYVAGYIAGVNNLSWEEARFGFNGLERLTSGVNESLQSVNAQRGGWNHDHPIGVQRVAERKATMDKLKKTNPEMFYPRGLKW